MITGLKANRSRLGYVGSTPGERDSNAWFTPEAYLESARRSFTTRTIELDPFSSDEANRAVKAVRYYTEENSAYRHSWKAQTLWMNPPYSGKECSLAVFKFLAEWRLSSFAEGIFLVNNATETKWFQMAMRVCDALCFTDHRISFWNADGKAVSGNTRGQAFFYFGPEPHAFAGEFVKHGAVILGRSVR